MHEEIFFLYFKASKSMTVETTHEQEKTIITITYTGKIGQRNLEEIEIFQSKGFLMDLVY